MHSAWIDVHFHGKDSCCLDSIAKCEGARERYRVLRVTCYNTCYTSFTLLLLPNHCLWFGRVDNDDGRKTEMFCVDKIIPMLHNIKVNFHFMH